MSPTNRPVDPDADGDLLFSWVSQPRARCWGMTGKDRDEVAAIYGYIAEQEHLAAYLVHLGGAPVALFQTYDPWVDEIGEYYERRPGDVGVHLLLADEPARAGHTGEVVRFFLDFVARTAQARRIVVEPDVRNKKSVALLRRMGFAPGPVVRLPGKLAQFGFLDL